MLSFTVCWVIPRERRGRKTSRDSEPWPKKPHIYIYIFFLSSLQAQSSNAGDGQLTSSSPSPRRLPPHASARLRARGKTSARSSRRFRHQGPAPAASREPSAATNPALGASAGLLRPLRRPLLLRSPVPAPAGEPRGRRAPPEQQQMAPLSLSRHTIM